MAIEGEVAFEVAGDAVGIVGATGVVGDREHLVVSVLDGDAAPGGPAATAFIVPPPPPAAPDLRVVLRGRR